MLQNYFLRFSILLLKLFMFLQFDETSSTMTSICTLRSSITSVTLVL